MNVRLGQICMVLGFALAACQQQQQLQQQETPADTPAVPVAETALPKLPAKDSAPQGKKETAAPSTPKYEPVKMGAYVPRVPGRRVASVSVPGPYVALTFDDGPSPAYTPRILDILKAHGARATFFVAGENAVGNKRILARAAAEGHEIGAHTYSHINLCKSGDDRIDREMTRTNAIILEATGRRPVVMRPPYGATNARLVDKMYADYGMTSILWDVDTEDWRHPGVSVVVRRAVTWAKPGSIILVHDIHESTMKAVEDIVTGLQERGFTLVTVSELLALGGKEPAPVPGGEAGADAQQEGQPAPEGEAAISGPSEDSM